MDEETRHFLEKVHVALDRRIDRLSGEIAAAATATKQELDEIRSAMVTKHDLREFRQSVLTYSSHVEMMLKEFAASDKDLSSDVKGLSSELEHLKRRVAALEKRLPPEATA